MPDLTYFILHDVIRVLLIAIVIISIPLAVLYMVRRFYINNALKTIENLQSQLRSVLSDPDNYREADYEERAEYARGSLLTGLVIYLLIMGIGFIKTYIEEGRLYIDEGGIFAAVVVAIFISIFLIRDLLLIAPWVTVYRIKVIKCVSTMGKNSTDYVCYYDFIKQDFAAGSIKNNDWFGTGAKEIRVYDALAIVKRNRLKVIGKAKEKKGD